MAWWDFSGAWVVCNSSKIEGKGGLAGSRCKKHQNGCQNLIFDVMSKVQKDLEEVAAGIGTFKKILYRRILSGI
jgi:hypothetical protein